MNTPKPYWFPAKRFGWGWGLPTCWQGWLVLAGYGASVAFIHRLLPPARDPVLFGVGVMMATAALLVICWRKGEPPGVRRR